MAWFHSCLTVGPIQLFHLLQLKSSMVVPLIPLFGWEELKKKPWDGQFLLKMPPKKILTPPLKTSLINVVTNDALNFRRDASDLAAHLYRSQRPRFRRRLWPPTKIFNRLSFKIETSRRRSNAPRLLRAEDGHAGVEKRSREDGFDEAEIENSSVFTSIQIRVWNNLNIT